MPRSIIRTLPQRQYIGQVATRCQIPDTAFNAFAASWCVRMYHYMRDTVPWVQVVPGGGWGASSSGEAVPSGASFSTVTGSIEYPAGTFHQLTWKGSTQLTFGLNPTIAAHTSDPCYVAIPAGAKFYTRIYANVPSGATVWSIAGGQQGGPDTPGTWMDLANGDAAQYNSGDLTMSGTITDDASISPGQVPILAILGPTRKATIGGLGDSRMQGWYDSPVANVGDFGELMHAVGPNFANINCSVGGDTVGEIVTGTQSSLRRQLLAYCSHICVELGGNDIQTLSSSAATILGQYQTLLGMKGLVGKPVYFHTLGPASTSSDNWATTANQTVVGGGLLPIRNAVNLAIRQGLPNAAGFFDPCVYQEFNYLSGGGTGLWIAGGITQDGYHMKPAGYVALGASGTVGIPNRFTTVR